MNSPVRAKPFVTSMRRGRLHHAPAATPAWTALIDRAAATLPHSGITPSTSMSPARSHSASRTEIRLGARAHTTRTTNRAHEPPRPTAIIRDSPIRRIFSHRYSESDTLGPNFEPWEAAMHAVVFRVTIHDREQGNAFLTEQIVPGVSQAPGFVAGYWANVGGDQGTSMVVFESEEAARQVADQGRRPPSDVVTVESVEVGEVVAHA